MVFCRYTVAAAMSTGFLIVLGPCAEHELGSASSQSVSLEGPAALCVDVAQHIVLPTEYASASDTK